MQRVPPRADSETLVELFGRRLRTQSHAPAPLALLALPVSSDWTGMLVDGYAGIVRSLHIRPPRYQSGHSFRNFGSITNMNSTSLDCPVVLHKG